ncbi:hypothetical protein BJX63DRAFT_377121 [Aspergillus granulosus]|uniref:Zn(2)-C6 fungal-type domain-containing protein n=1 Tax=Aspergillus granulosus TaxID=176169 RepID=A0ABR4I6W4_9EURO
MFGTLRYEATNKDGEFLEHEMSVSGFPMSRLQHMACDNCRVKKIRCSGRRTGCYRCTALGVPCTYSGPSPRKRSRKKSPLSYESGAGGDEDSRMPRDISSESAESRTEGHSRNYYSSPRNSSAPHDNKDSDPSQLIQLGMECAGQEDEQFFLNSFDWHLSDHHGQRGSPPMSTGPTPIMHLAAESNKRSLSTTADANSMTHSKNSLFHSGNMVYNPPSLCPSGVVDDHIPLDPMLSHLTPPPNIKSGQSLLPSSPTRNPSKTAVVKVQEPRGCTCLATAVFLLDELERSGDDDPHEEKKLLDSHLSSYREILSLCENMLQCRHCCRRPENMTVLNLVLERQANLSSSMVGAYLALTSSTDGDNAPAAQPQSHDHSKLIMETESTSTSTAALLERPEMSLGDYNIAKSEWETMVRVLIFTQLSAFDRLIGQMKQLPSLAQRESQMTRLRTSELRNRRIARRLWPALSESVPMAELDGNIMSESK